MDTSREYVAMCEKAEEIQVLRPVGKEWELGDFYYFRSSFGKERDFDGVAGDSNGYDEYFINREQEEIWLPRQDQLQDMVIIEGVPAMEAWTITYYPTPAEGKGWHKYEMSLYSLPVADGDTLEQLWLAFVMQELYQKHWSGTDWVKE